MAIEDLSIVVIIPCYNEAVTIASVIRDFREALPTARIVVCDNNSSDDTVAIALAEGAEVRHERLQGKGNAVRRMFAVLEADVYVMVDGDATYEAAAAPALIKRLHEEGLDLVVGRRVTSEADAYRSGHRFGNWALTTFTGWIFGRTFADMLSGYRVMSRGYVKSYPAHARGFDTEVELAVHALELRLPVAEVDTVYLARPEGSFSKLSTYKDGIRILGTVLAMTRNGRPLAFFGFLAALCVVVAVMLALPLVATYLETGLVPRFPTAILSASLVLMGSVFFASGLILDTVAVARREHKYGLYLQHSRKSES